MKVNKVKVELVPNGAKIPNIIHAFGTTKSADDFATWKLQNRGCARYCFGWVQLPTRPGSAQSEGSPKRS